MTAKAERGLANFNIIGTDWQLYNRENQLLKTKTERLKSRYPELEEFKRLNSELVKEKGDQYAFKEILVGDRADEEIFVTQYFPEYIVVPQGVLENYRQSKKIFKKHFDYFKTGMKMHFIYGKENLLEGPATKADIIKEDLEKKSSLGKIASRLFKGKIKEAIKLAQKRISLKGSEVKIENQTDLQTLLTSNNIAEDAAIYLVTQNILYDGIDSGLAGTEKELNREARNDYPSLNEKFIKEVIKKQMRIIDELTEEYEEYEKSLDNNPNQE